MPLALFGIFRFLFLLYQKSDAASPTEAILRDPPFLVNLALWGVDRARADLWHLRSARRPARPERPERLAAASRRCARARARPAQRRLLALLFFASGAAGLVDQVAWLRYLSLVFGNTTLATATLLAVFMAGLGLGRPGSSAASPIARRDR